jgi:RNA polymerase sigma-70 factor, ECF subfamily
VTTGLDSGMSDDHRADHSAVRAVLDGDRRAFGTLVDRHLPAVVGVVSRIVCNRADAEDLAQDTFVRAFQRLDQYGQAHSFRNWLLKIATNLALNHLQARRRERNRYPRIAEDRPECVEPIEDGPELPSPREWQHWLSKLDEPQRAAIVLFHFHELSYAEVAEALDVPINTVRTHLHRGRRRLRELMSTRPLSESESWNAVIQNC